MWLLDFLFTRTETDAFFVAFRFPNFFRRFFGEGALTVSFVPVFIECLHQPGSKEENMAKARNLMNSIYTLLLVCISIVTAIGVIFMDSLVHFMFDQHTFSQVAGKIEMTIFLSRLLFFYLFLVVTYAYYSAIANALHQFFIPALAPAGFNLSIILSVFLIPQEWFLNPTTVLAIGVLMGGFVQMGMVACVLMRLRFLPTIQLSVFFTTIKYGHQAFFTSHHWSRGFCFTRTS